MKGEPTAVIEPAPEGGFWTICLEIPGAKGQGESLEGAKNDLQASIELLLEDREADVSRSLPADAVPMTLRIGWNAAISNGGYAWLDVYSKGKEAIPRHTTKSRNR